jgi:hypothetical protein
MYGKQQATGIMTMGCYTALPVYRVLYTLNISSFSADVDFRRFTYEGLSSFDSPADDFATI